MKYGRYDIRRNLRALTTDRIEQKAGMTLVRLLIIFILTLIVSGSCVTFGIIQGLIESAPDVSSFNTAPVEAATYIYDTNGNPLQKLTAPTSNRIPISISEMPDCLQHAIVAIEDERFYVHNGIDVRGIIRAFVVGVRNRYFSEGASTITQQLLKNSVFTGWTTESSLIESFKRKFQEQYLAIKLEDYLEETMDKEHAKQKILEDYLNTVNLGAGTYGVQAAAQRYFSKDASELTLSEATVIVGITQNPTGYDPILHPQANAKRRKQVLNAMFRQHYISKKAYKRALADPVYDRIQELADVTDDSQTIYSYYTDALIEQVSSDLVNIAGYSSNQANHALYSGGLKIYSVQDPEIQKICDEEFNNPENYPADTLIGLDYALSIINKKGKTVHFGSQDVYAYFKKQDPSFRMMFPDEETARYYASEFKKAKVKKNTTFLGERIFLVPQPQASVVIIDQNTGFVKACVGGRGKKEASLTLNRATSTRRQPGSTFKPLAVYAPAIEIGKKTLASVYDNAPYTYASGGDVLNWDSDSGYSGLESIHNAITRSINVVAVKVLEEISPQTGLDYLEQLGISTLYNNETDSDGNLITDAYPSLALGGVTDGVINLELTAAYAALANGGSYIAPKFYSRVEDSHGNIILNNTSEETPVFSKQTAYLITSAMKSVISNPQGTAYNYINLGDMPVCGKSGTTDSYKDIWFEGYTPYYTCGIWGGYDNNEPLPDYDHTFSSYAKTLWNSIMTRIHADLPTKDFSIPKKIVTAQICSKSGRLAVPGLCDLDPRGSTVISEQFAKGTVPKKSCNVHTQVKICAETGLVASNSCTNTYSMVYLNLPDGSSTETYDAQYRVPEYKCSGHTKKKDPTKQTEQTETKDPWGFPVDPADPFAEDSYGNTNEYPYGNTNEYPYGNTNEYPYGNTNEYPYGSTNEYPYGNENMIMVDGQWVDLNAYQQNEYNGYDFNSIPADDYYNNGVNMY